MALSRSVLAERLLGLASLSALLGVVTAVDERARIYLSTLATNPAAEFAILTGRASRIVHSVVEVLGLQAYDQTMVIAFGLASLGLVVLMFRT